MMRKHVIIIVIYIFQKSHGKDKDHVMKPMMGEVSLET